MYAYLLKKIHPEINIKKLMIIHYEHDGNDTHYKLDYCENEMDS